MDVDLNLQEFMRQMEVLRCKPGDVLVLRPTRPLSQANTRFYWEALRRFEEHSGVKVLLLPHEIEVTAVQESNGGA
jgi:hypothetical protein